MSELKWKTGAPKEGGRYVVKMENDVECAAFMLATKWELVCALSGNLLSLHRVAAHYGPIPDMLTKPRMFRATYRDMRVVGWRNEAQHPNIYRILSSDGYPFSMGCELDLIDLVWID